MMSWNPDELSGYRKDARIPDYADPAYYKQGDAPAPRSAQPALPAALSPAAPDMAGYDPGKMSAYRGPASLEGYTHDAGADQRELAKHGKISEGRKKKLAGLGGIGAFLVGLLVKLKTLLVVLFDLKWFAVFGKFAFAGITAIISVAVYASIFGWPFGIGLVVLLFIHEMGHALVMKLKGIPIGGMIFIPLLGAMVTMRQMPKNAKDEAEVGIAGPVAGAIASSVCFLLAQSNPLSFWTALAYFGFLINLFNLIPIVPFDGGRVLAAIDRRLWILGFIGLVAFQVWSFVQYHSISPFLLLFIVLAAMQFWARRRAADTPEGQAYYQVSVGERIALTLAYFGLAAVLVLGMTAAHGMLFGSGL
jgi:Zn-dependent protease